MKYTVLFASLLAATSALAAPPPTILSWVTPTGTVKPDESIGVWVRLTVDPSAAQALALDGSATNFDLPTEFPEFQSVSEVLTNTWLACDNTFIPGRCNDPTAAYTVEWNFGADSFVPYYGSTPQPLNITLQPGQSRDFLIATFHPRNGTVPEGPYALTSAGLQLSLRGYDLNGQPIERRVDLGIGCVLSTGCAPFERLVSAVPEPGTPLLMLAGCVALAVRRARQARHAAPAEA